MEAFLTKLLITKQNVLGQTAICSMTKGEMRQFYCAAKSARRKMSLTESDNFAMLMTPNYCKINLAENKILRGPAKNLRGPAVEKHCPRRTYTNKSSADREYESMDC